MLFLVGPIAGGASAAVASSCGLRWLPAVSVGVQSRPYICLVQAQPVGNVGRPWLCHGSGSDRNNTILRHLARLVSTSDNLPSRHFTRVHVTSTHTECCSHADGSRLLWIVYCGSVRSTKQVTTHA